MISVIIPVYNAEDYLGHCVTSIKNQIYTNVEIILVDDGSTDGSAIMCDTLAEEDGRVRVIHQENQGASLARKRGIKMAKGEYISFVDSDDYVEPEYLSAIYEAMVKYGCSLASCNMINHKEYENCIISDIPSSCCLRGEDLFTRFFHYEFWGLCGGMYRRDVFNDLYFPEATVNEDYVVKLQLFHRERRMAFVNAPLYHYLIHENSLSHQKITKRAFEEFSNKVWAYEYCCKYMPQYLRYSEAQTAETCIKLLNLLKSADFPSEYSGVMGSMKDFLMSHCVSLLLSRHLLLGLKAQIIKLLLV